MLLLAPFGRSAAIILLYYYYYCYYYYFDIKIYDQSNIMPYLAIVVVRNKFINSLCENIENKEKFYAYHS